MPWAKNGEQWHSSVKGFPPGQGCRWEQGLLKQLMTIIGKIDPDAEINYNLRDAIHIKPSYCKAFCLRIKTKEADYLQVICYCNKGQFNITRIEGLAPTIDYITSKPKGDEAHLFYSKIKDLDALKLAAFLKELRAGLLQMHGTGTK